MKILRTFEGYEGDIEGDGEGCGGGELWEDMEVNMVDGSVCVCVSVWSNTGGKGIDMEGGMGLSRCTQ